MKAQPKEISTAQRIQTLQSRRTNIVLLVVNIVLICTAIACWCYLHDSAYSGEYDPVKLIGLVQRRIEFTHPMRRGLLTLNYIISAPGLEPAVINASAFFYIMAVTVPFVMILEAVVVGVANLFGAYQVRKQLQPLYKLAEAAQQLSNAEYDRPQKRSEQPKPIKQSEAYPTEQIHSLESAIDNLHPERSDASLHTGDKDLKGLEDAINSLLKRTRDSYTQQIRFVSDASHELRTPIAVVKGYTDMLDRWGKKDETVLDESISAIKAETEHMNKLVEQLLFLARGDSGRTQLNKIMFSLSDMVRDVYEESVMIDSNHKWELYAKNEIVAFGDSSMLKQATRILVENASKYTQSGETIILKAILDKEGNPAIVVQDSGVGIAQEDMNHIFERFYRSDSSRGRQQGGTGLGLAIAKWIVDSHNGYFEILSREDIGTRVTIHLPMSEDPTDRAEPH
ncbi:MAG: HAMP domain-containing sensor histidine kinase [Oscillospiraceae bacterium]